LSQDLGFIFDQQQLKELVMNTMLIGMPGGAELLIILLVVLLLFGGSKLPQLAKALGQSKRAFKDGLDEAEQEAQKEVKEKQA
jgi:sec-independent protein translocase protein TatA